MKRASHRASDAGTFQGLQSRTNTPAFQQTGGKRLVAHAPRFSLEPLNCLIISLLAIRNRCAKSPTADVTGPEVMRSFALRFMDVERSTLWHLPESECWIACSPCMGPVSGLSVGYLSSVAVIPVAKGRAQGALRPPADRRQGRECLAGALQGLRPIELFFLVLQELEL